MKRRTPTRRNPVARIVRRLRKQVTRNRTKYTRKEKHR
jgi:hypothetical protein